MPFWVPGKGYRKPFRVHVQSYRVPFWVPALCHCVLSSLSNQRSDDNNSWNHVEILTTEPRAQTDASLRVLLTPSYRYSPTMLAFGALGVSEGIFL